jgi:hypothetical protein
MNNVNESMNYDLQRLILCDRICNLTGELERACGWRHVLKRGLNFDTLIA